MYYYILVLRKGIDSIKTEYFMPFLKKCDKNPCFVTLLLKH